jgi:hypothetical protein
MYRIFMSGSSILSCNLPEAYAIQVDEPDLRIPVEVNLPGAVSPKWLVEQVMRGASEELGPVYVLGPVGASQDRALYASPTERVASERLSLTLRCSGELYFLALTRELQGQRNSRYAILLPEMSQQNWEWAIHGAARSLYN